MTHLVLLHGPPASGKFTIAKELQKLVPARLFHNHLTLDVAKSLFNFGKPEFWDLVHEVRLLSLKSYFDHGVAPLIVTWCYEDPEDYDLFKRIEAVVTSRNGQILPVYLECDQSSLESRIANEHRQAMDKLTDIEHLQKIMREKNYAAIPYDSCIQVDTTAKPAHANAQDIARLLDS